MRRSSEHITKHNVEYARVRDQHAVSYCVSGNLPVVQVRWLEVQCNRHEWRKTYTY